MFKEITPYDASALVGLHSTLTAAGLVERLLAPPGPPPRRGLSGYLSRGLIEWACESNHWSAPAQRSYLIDSSEDISPLAPPPALVSAGIALAASAWTTVDDTGQTVSLTALHLPQFSYSRDWNKSGLVPPAYVMQAQWIMALAGTMVHGYVVLADKSATIHWVDRDQGLIEQLRSALAELADHVASGTRPSIDAALGTADADAPATPSVPASPSEVSAAIERWLTARANKAETTTRATLAADEYEAAHSALVNLIPAGSHHDHDQLRIHHNARTGRITEEKLNVEFF